MTWVDVAMQAIPLAVAAVVFLLAHFHVRQSQKTSAGITKLLADLVAAGHGKAIDHAGGLIDDIKELVKDFRETNKPVIAATAEVVKIESPPAA